jgi:hypothetical protein
MIAPEHFVGGIATVTLGVIFGLVGVIYRSLVKRIEKAERLLEIVLVIRTDVKHILAHCAHCPESLEDENGLSK